MPVDLARPAIAVVAAAQAALAPQPLHQRQAAAVVLAELRRSQALPTLVAAGAVRSVQLLAAAVRAAVALAGLLVLWGPTARRIRGEVLAGLEAAQMSLATTAAAELSS
jgi:hypothetical protein